MNFQAALKETIQLAYDQGFWTFCRQLIDVSETKGEMHAYSVTKQKINDQISYILYWIKFMIKLYPCVGFTSFADLLTE